MSRSKKLVEHEAAGGYLAIDANNIFYREQGSGPPVLMVHGVPSSSYLYRKMFDPLAEAGCRPIAFDFLGMGLSDKPLDCEYDWHALSDLVGKVVDELGLETVHLVVHDFGGPTAVEWAVKNPWRIASLTILNTPLDVERFYAPFPMNLYRMPLFRHVAIQMNSVTAYHALMRNRGVYKRDSIDREDIATYLDLLTSGNGKSTFLKIMAGDDISAEFNALLRGGMKELDAPVQVLWGEKDVAIPFFQAEYLRDELELAAFHTLPAGHFLQEDEPLELSRLIAELVNKA